MLKNDEKSYLFQETALQERLIWKLMMSQLAIESSVNTCFDLVSLPHFRQDFWRKKFLTLYFIDWPNFIAWLPLALEMLVNKCSVIICLPVCEVIIFKINLKLSSPFPAWPKSKGKEESEVSEERKELLPWNKKHFSSVLKMRPWYRCFPVNFCEIFKNIFFYMRK